MTMAVNLRLTHVVKDRAVQKFRDEWLGTPDQFR